MNRFVYLDNNATTKMSAEVQEKIKPYLDLQFGNPSSLYAIGKKVKEAISVARESFASLVNCDSKNIIFTSGGSESNCAAFNSAINQFPNKKKFVTTKVEHSSILEYCKLLEKRGCEVVYLDVDKNCKIDTKQLEKEIDDNTCLVSIQFANNEVGTILVDENVVKTINKLKKKHNFLFHIDCVQGLGKTNIDLKKLSADFASFSGHKIHCPKGIGALFVKNTKAFTPLIAGHQEFGLRGGTENVVGIVALGQACSHIKENSSQTISKLVEVHNYLENELQKIDGLTINCQSVTRIPNTTSITFEKHSGNQMMFELEKNGICVSTGSACNSESSEPSYVLTSMGIKNPQNTIRISIDENTTNSAIDYFINSLNSIIKGGK